MKYHQLKWPREHKITERTATIRSSFVRAIIPFIKPTDQEIQDSLKELQQDPDDLRCSYCGSQATEWDHFRPVLKEKHATGNITDIYNLVPCCAKCNESKSNFDWDSWITGKTQQGPEKVDGRDGRVQILKHFEEWSNTRTHRLSDQVLNDDRIQAYMNRCEELVNTFAGYQVDAGNIKQWI
ncbi:MAG: HNH endonuclease, partial [Flavobacteriales bacterium]